MGFYVIIDGMNIHPIIVHFPVAFLFIWSLCEIFPVEKWFSNTNWKSIKNFLVIVGFLGAVVARATGENAEHLLGVSDQNFRNLIETHATFAGASTLLFGIFAIEIVLRFLISRFEIYYSKLGILKNLIDFILKALEIKVIRIILAICALIAIFTTGLLGGVIVYGPNLDPLAPYVLKILGISL